MLKRDIELTRVSAGGLMGVWQGLENTRESLVSYQRNVGHYKVRSRFRIDLSLNWGRVLREQTLKNESSSRRPDSLATTSRATRSRSTKKSPASRRSWTRCAARSNSHGVAVEEARRGPRCESWARVEAQLGAARGKCTVLDILLSM
jgi:hypothetical protein